MSDEYLPLTADTFKALYGPEPPAFDDGHVNVLVKGINDVKGGEGLAQQIAQYDSARVAALTPPPYQPLEDKDFRGMFPENTEFDDGQVKNFLGLVSDAKLRPEQVKSIVEFDTKRMEAAQAAHDAAWQEQETKWQGELEKDSFLSEGEGLKSNLETIQKFIKSYGGEPNEAGDNEFQEMLKTSGLGNHPAMARLLLRAARAVPGEGRPVHGGPAGGDRSPASILFDKT